MEAAWGKGIALGATMQTCRFCGSERTSASRTRCENCAGNDWRWKDDPGPTPVLATARPDPEPRPRADRTPVREPKEYPKPPVEDDGLDPIEFFGNAVAGCGWIVVLVLVGFLVYCAVRGTMETNREMRAGRFQHGYETQDDIKDYPEEYAKALRDRAETREREAARMAREKAAQEAAERNRQMEKVHAEAVDPNVQGTDRLSPQQDPE